MTRNRLTYLLTYFYSQQCAEKVNLLAIVNDVVKLQQIKLGNVTIANALQLEAARATPVLCRFNYDAMPSLTSLNLFAVL